MSDEWIGFRDNQGNPSLGFSFDRDSWWPDNLGDFFGTSPSSPSLQRSGSTRGSYDGSDGGSATVRPWEGYYQPGYDGPSPKGSTWNRPTGHVNGGNGGGGGNGGSNKNRGQMTFAEFMRYQQRQQAKADAAVAAEERQSVYDWVRSTFKTWGMPEGMAGDVIDIVKDARSPEQAMVQIRETDAYKERFAGNIARAKAGFGMLDEASYLQLESSYRQSMHAAGLPKGFYDDPSDFSKFISQDVSPEEIARRAEIAGDLAQKKDPQLWKELQARGISKGDAAAYMLDPDRALPAIEKKLKAAEIGQVARETGMGFRKGKGFENKLADKGISADQARVAFNAVDDKKDALNQAAGIYGEDKFSDKDLAKAELGIGGRKAKRRAKSLASRERAQWSGSGGGTGVFGSPQG